MTVIDLPPLESRHTPERSDEEFEYKILTNPYERMHYVHLTDDLIRRLDGSDKVNPKPDFVIFLDKSARPVNWMVHALWDQLAAKDENGNTPDRPQSLFVNIDARRRKDESDDAMADLRALFTVDEPRPGLETMNQETILDGKQVLIVDEIAVSGDTLVYADKLLERAYPGAQFQTYSWMDGRPKTQGGTETNNPRWYERNSDRYRVVTEKVDEERGEELLQEGERIRRGWKWIAKLPKVASPQVRILHEEIKQLAIDIKSGALPYWPSLRREDDDERIENFNGINADDFYSFRHWMQTRFWPDVYTAGSITDKTGPLSDKRAFEEARFNKAGSNFNRLPLTERAKEFRDQFSFTSETMATDSLATAVKRTRS